MNQTSLQIKSTPITGDYVINWSDKLGTGVNGPVYSCQGVATGTKYALKLLKDTAQGHREVQLHHRCIPHPHIVNVQDVYSNSIRFPGDPTEHQALFVVMELMEGGELFDRIAKAAKFTERNAARFTKQIALSIQRCHSLNIAHRDLKPENLLLKDDKEDAVVKLGDFGFAKVDDGNLTTPHFTPYYVAPQVLEAKRKSQSEHMNMIGRYTYDKCCDMWSLGVIVYIMLCGYPPFCPTTPSDSSAVSPGMQKRIMSAQYEFSQDDWSHISVQAKDVVKRLLMVDPEKRMIVTELLSHPWLADNSFTDIILNSPSVLLDKNMLFETQGAHSAQLTNLRRPDRQIQLKPLAKADNAMIRKRKQSQTGMKNENHHHPPTKRRPPDKAPQRLQDLANYCSMSLADGRVFDSEHLGRLVSGARQENPESRSLQDILSIYSWNGAAFEQPINLEDFSRRLQNLIHSLKRDKT